MAYERTPNTLGIRNNNPFNIRWNKRNKWKGQTGRNKGFCVFESMDYGFRAGLYLLRSYIRRTDLFYGRCNTVSSIINRYAPIVENDSERYIKYLVNAIQDNVNPSFDRNTPIDYPSKEFAQMCVSIVYYESQYSVPVDYIYTIINHFKLY